MTTLVRFLTALLLLASLSGCSAKVSNSIPLPYIPLPETMPDTGKGAMVFVEEIKDARASQSLGQGTNGPMSPVGSPTTAVRNSIEELLRKSGFTVTDSAPIVLQVQLQEWSANVRDGYPSGVASEARISIAVYDPGNKLAYSGMYKGTSDIQQSSLDDRTVKDALASSMSQALTQFSKDSQVQKLIASF